MNIRSVLLFVIAVVSTVLTSAVLAQDSRSFEPLDRGFGYRFDYPVRTHSVRTSNLMQPAELAVPFGALIAVEPNDSYLYAGGAQPTYFTRMRVLAGFNAEQVADDIDLASYLGTSPLLQYDPANVTVELMTLGGQPAVRATGIPTAPGAGTTEIITVFEGLVYEIIIEPVPLQLGFDAGAEVVLDPVYSDILNTWAFQTPTN